MVIVIAVIAILAAVLIPTFTGIIKKANISADTQLVRNLNTALAEDKAINGEHKTMQSALDAAVEGGYIVARINAKATGNEILWDSVADAFCYLNDGKVEYTPDVTGEKAKDTEQYKLWKIDSVPSKVFSTYLYNIGETTTFNDVKTGIDVGNETVTSITYVGNDSAQDVVIRTNSINTKLTINAPQDDIKHVGLVGDVIIEAVASTSYVEAGKVNGYISLQRGNLVLSPAAEVFAVVVEPVDGAIVSVDFQQGASLEMIATTVALDSAMVAKLPTNLQEAAERPVSEPEELEQIKTGASLFAGGKGTESEPFLISNREELQNISKLSWTYYAYGAYYGYPGFTQMNWADACAFADTFNTSSAYYKIKDGITTIDGGNNWSSIYLDGNFDGNGVTFTNLKGSLFKRVENDESIIVLSNFTVQSSQDKIFGSHAAAVVDATSQSIEFNNVNVTGTIIGYSVASYIGKIYGDGETSYVFNNSISTALLIGYGEYASGFIGYSNLGDNYSGAKPISLTLNDSYFIGTLYSSANYYYSWGNNAGWFSSFADNSKDKENYVELTGSGKQLLGGTYIFDGGTRNLYSSSGSIEEINIGDSLSKTAAIGTTFSDVLTIISPNGTNESGSYTSLYYSESITPSNGILTTQTTKRWNIVINGDNTKAGIDGNNFNIVNESLGHTHNGYSVYFVEYSDSTKTKVTAVTCYSFGKSK